MRIDVKSVLGTSYSSRYVTKSPGCNLLGKLVDPFTAYMDLEISVDDGNAR